MRQLPGYLAGDRWVESRSLSYILAYRFSVRDESHRLSWSFILVGIPKDTSIRFQRESTQSYLFTAFSMSLQSQTRASLLFFPCPTLLPHLHRSVHQKFFPLFCVVCLLRSLCDTEQGRILCRLKHRDKPMYFHTFQGYCYSFIAAV